MFNILEKKKIFFTIPLVIVLAGIICMFVFGGFNLDIDFAGGTELVVDFGKEINKSDIETAVKDAVSAKSIVIQQSLINTSEYSIKTETLNAEQQEKLWNGLKEKFTLEDEARISVDSVSPTIGKELTQSAILAIIIAVILMLIYITFRFELLSGVAAVVALIHDVLIMLSFYVILQIPFNTTAIAALLTIIGYSINDTIVIFDRIRENVRASRREPFGDIANRSVWQTMMRTINTSVTTIVMVVVLYIFGVSAIKDFALALIIGLLAGTYSSIFVATPIWCMIRGNKNTQAPAKKSK
ncbi:MAG: protein translocase subunit SecF [Clostridia bacterium]|nr:protein translocase subunit SecF [Clostridia bacterium]